MRLLLAASITILIGLFSALPLCNLLFSCGCTFWEGITHCNVLVAGPPDCPWCAYGSTGFYIPFSLILVGAVSTTLIAVQRFRTSLWVGIVAGFAGYLFWGFLIGFTTAVYRDYPLFLGWRF